MGRIRFAGTLLAALVAVAPARGAEITRVLSSGDPDSPFGFSLEVGYRFAQKTAKISREFGNNGAVATGTVDMAPELTYSRTSHRVVPRLAIGLWHDLELRAEMPYVIAEDAKWADASANVGGTPISSILGNTLDASGAPCTGGCPMFPLASGNELHAGAALDDLKIGFAWAVLSERRDPVAPTWVVSFDLTVPTAARFDPAAGRLTQPAFAGGPRFTTSARAAVGQKIWIYEIATALSKRVGLAEPYFKARIAIPQASSQTYSNCEHAADLVLIGQMWQGSGGVNAATECRSAAWQGKADAQPPLLVGVTAGVEVVPQDDRATGQRLAIDFRLGGEMSGESRWYNELTPATGKLLHTDAFAVLSGQVGLSYRTSRYFALSVRGNVQHELGHFISGESLRGSIINGAGQNPNYDWRWDPAGRRFRVSETLVYGGTASLIFGF